MGFGIALGYEDVADHDELRHDPIMAVLAGRDRRSRQAMHDADKHYVDTIALSLRRTIAGIGDGVASRTSGNASAASTQATTRDEQAGDPQPKHVPSHLDEPQASQLVSANKLPIPVAMILLATNLDIQSPAVGAYQCKVKLVMVDSELWDRSSR